MNFKNPTNESNFRILRQYIGKLLPNHCDVLLYDYWVDLLYNWDNVVPSARYIKTTASDRLHTNHVRRNEGKGNIYEEWTLTLLQRIRHPALRLNETFDNKVSHKWIHEHFLKQEQQKIIGTSDLSWTRKNADKRE